MEAYTKLTLAVLMAAAVAAGREMAVAGGQGVYCGMDVEGLMACKPSVAVDQDPVPPSSACCSALSGADVGCLCRYKNNKSLIRFLGINPKLATQLPAKCNLPGSVPCA
ncbi:hypothetical protein NMG60_11019613 [Bertholletia excelsa]